MLFDLQSRGRRNVVKIIYLWLAILMGGGLILFGIGTGGTGGLFDAFGGGADTSSQVSNVEKRANRAIRTNPQDAAAWAELARARYQTAGLGENYDTTQSAFTESGREKLTTAVAAWQRYLRLEPAHPDVGLARLMAQAYSEVGLNQPPLAADALEIVTEEQPSAASYAQLAQYSYLADEMRKGDLAAARAVVLAPKTQKLLLRRQLADVKRQVNRLKAEDGTQQGGLTGGG